VNAFSAPVFDYSGNIVLAITLMGSSGIFDSSWTGAQAQAIKVLLQHQFLRRTGGDGAAHGWL